jgi:predicted house-cleaning NTP pyrophosphatase (Maf/HAM1 superfamily)
MSAPPMWTSASCPARALRTTSKRLAIWKSAAAPRDAHDRQDRRGGRRRLSHRADTAVIVDDEILGKPAHDEDAGRMLRRLSGRRHRVLTGVSVRTAERQVAIVEETLCVLSSTRRG